MGPLPPTIIQIMSHFAPLFSARVWPHAQVLLTGALLAPGKRTVSALLRVMGLDQRSDFQTYHRVLNRCVWSPLAGSRRLLQVLVATFAPRGRLVFGLDDTIERRRGRFDCGQGHLSRSGALQSGALCQGQWVTLVVADVAGARILDRPGLGVAFLDGVVSVRALLSDARSSASTPAGARPTDAAAAGTLAAHPEPCRGRRPRLFGVGPSSMPSGSRSPSSRACAWMRRCLSRPPPRRPGTVGRPRCKGERLPTLQARLDDPNTPWQECTINAWYATGKRTLQIVSDTAVWYHAGLPPVPIRWLVVKDPNGQFPPQALLSTDETITPQQMLTYFIQRWTVETTFEEARAHLGMETQRQWNDQAIARTTPVVLALFAIVALLADTLGKKNSL